MWETLAVLNGLWRSSDLGDAWEQIKERLSVSSAVRMLTKTGLPELS